MPPALDGEFGFAASGTCVETAGKTDAWIAGGGAAARVFHSTDRGATWTVVDTPIVRSDAGGIFSLAVRDTEPRRRGRRLREAEQERRTPRRTPTTAARPGPRAASSAATAPARRSCRAPGPVPSTGVIAVGPTGTDVSQDGGVTWLPVKRGAFDAVECTADGACWASGSDGRVGVLVGLKQSVAAGRSAR